MFLIFRDFQFSRHIPCPNGSISHFSCFSVISSFFKSSSRCFSFSMIFSLHQKPREPLSDFILRTKMSLERKIPNPTARDLLLKTIVWEGMTSESGLACQGLREEHHDRWTVATRDLGTASHQATSVAQAFVAAVKTEGICFKCGERTLE